MRVLIDADACPVIQIILEVTEELNIEVIIVTDTAHIFNYQSSRVQVVVVDKGKDSVDFALINRVNENDIVITQDYGVAAMALSKKARAMDQNGKYYANETLDFMLMNRYITKEIRKAGGKMPSIKKRSKKQDMIFEKNFRALCHQKPNEI